MKFIMKLLVLFFSVLSLANAADSESPREPLKQMVEQLQKNPNDNALREKIIKLAQEIKPAPAVPEEAERRMMRGMAALEGVISVKDYQNAAKEFDQATLAAPWYGDAYFNLGVSQDKAENYEAALRSLKFALLASPDDKEIKALIFKVEYRNEKRSMEAGRDGPFVSYNNGTVLDTRTNLMWAAKDNGTSVNWANAKSYCENYRGGGYTDWRMPTQDELARLSDAGKTQRSKIEYDLTTRHLTKLIDVFPCCLWASETRGSEAAIFNFESSGRFWNRQSFDNNYRALPVRSGK